MKASFSKWQSAESFEPSFLARMQEMAKEIPGGSSILDLGCGPMWLKKILPPGCRYYPVDYIRRDDTTILCDFNNHEFPDIHVDVAFCGGILEYIQDPSWFIRKIGQVATRCIISYNTVESIPDRKTRTKLEWVNHLSKHQVIHLFEKQDMQMTSFTELALLDSLFVFTAAR